jgi:ATP adenylyltransferase
MDPNPKTLHEIYTGLHNKACRKILGSGATSSTTNAQSPISYNLGLTDRVMVLCPRASEGLKISNSNGEEIGPVSLNGTVLGGTLLVKSEEEWDVLRNDHSKLVDILGAIGFPPNKEHDEKL